MARLTLSTDLDEKFLLASEVNALFGEFATYVNTTGLQRDIFENSCVDYRHLKEPPVFFLADTHAGAAIGAPVAGSWGNTNVYIDFEPTYNTENAIVIDVWYYAHAKIEWATAVGINARASGGGYTPQVDTQVSIGSDKDDANTWDKYAISGATGGPQAHYITGAAGWLPPSCGLTLVRTSAIFGPDGSAAAYGNDRYNVMLNLVAGPPADTVSAFDVCYMFATAKDVD